MTPEEYRAWRKAYDAKRYVAKIKPERQVKRAAEKQRPIDAAYQRGFKAGQRARVR
jgi:hypothetical protein